MTAVVQRGLWVCHDPMLAAYRFVDPLFDSLTEGPQHVDLRAQHSLRAAFGVEWSDDARLGGWLPLFRHAPDIIFLSSPELGAVLGALWWIDAMRQHGADVGAVRLAVAPSYVSPPRVVLDALGDAERLGDAVEPLCDLRRAIAADTDDLERQVGTRSTHHREYAGEQRSAPPTGGSDTVAPPTESRARCLATRPARREGR